MAIEFHSLRHDKNVGTQQTVLSERIEPLLITCILPVRPMERVFDDHLHHPTICESWLSIHIQVKRNFQKDTAARIQSGIIGKANQTCPSRQCRHCCLDARATSSMSLKDHRSGLRNKRGRLTWPRATAAIRATRRRKLKTFPRSAQYITDRLTRMTSFAM